MTDFNYKGVMVWSLIALLALIALITMIATTGCVTAARTITEQALATPTPTPTPPPTPTPSPTPTPKQTPTSLPTLEQRPVDPFLHGERWEGQWFKWYRTDVSGLKDMYVGIVAYRHAFMDSYTWWNAATGNYQSQKPSPGKRYFSVWIHQEMFGTNATNDPRMWGMDKDSFRVQYKDQIIAADETYLPVNRIREFDNLADYYDTITAPPFGYRIIYTGMNPETAGMVADPIGWLRLGKGNSIDGFLLFEVPKEAFTEDVVLLGSFSTFGTAYWRFEE